MLLTLSTGHEIGLAVMGGLFISFALLSSFVFPRFIPDFPTRKGLRWYLPLCFCFFAAMLTAVIEFGRDEKVALATITTGPSSPLYANGNPAAGKKIFTGATGGCYQCHTFTPAGSTGTIGPDLDEIALYAKQANELIRPYTVHAIISPPPSSIPDTSDAMPTDFGTKLTKKQIADLVAFIDTPGD